MAEAIKKLIVKDSNPETEPLTRNHLFTPPIPLEGWEIGSIEQAFWTIYLCHHGLVAEARKFSQEVAKHPAGACLKAWAIMGTLGKTPNAALVLNGPKTYHSICTFLMRHRVNAFFLTITEIRRKYGSSVKFLVAGQSHAKTWTFSERQDKLLLSGRYPGFNLYGKALEQILREYTEGGSYQPKLDPELFFIAAEYDPVSYCYTALIISDSEFSQVHSIDGGRVKALSGATLADVANWINEYAGDLTQYRFVIVNAGINDAQRHPRTWESLVQPFCDIVKQYLDKPHLTFVVNGPIGLPEVPNATNFTQFLYDMLEDTGMSPYRHVFIDWSAIREDFENPLMLPDGQPNKDYFREEIRNGVSCWFHVNQKGFGVMWDVMCEQLPWLQRLGISMMKKDEKYPNGKFGP